MLQQIGYKFRREAQTTLLDLDKSLLVFYLLLARASPAKDKWGSVRRGQLNADLHSEPSSLTGLMAHVLMISCEVSKKQAGKKFAAT